MSALMDVLLACENQLGWVPQGRTSVQLIKSRAVMHHVMTQAMARRAISVDDLDMVVTWCLRRRYPVSSPLQLLTLLPQARQEAPSKVRPHELDTLTQEARDWEAARADQESGYWTGRLVRSIGPARADVLDEWRAAGRGR